MGRIFRVSPALYSTIQIEQVALLFECAAVGDSSIAADVVDDVAAAADGSGDNGDTALFVLGDKCGGDDNTCLAADECSLVSK